MIHRLLLIMLALAVALSMGGCSNAPETQEESTEAGSTDPTGPTRPTGPTGSDGAVGAQPPAPAGSGAQSTVTLAVTGMT